MIFEFLEVCNVINHLSTKEKKEREEYCDVIPYKERTYNNINKPLYSNNNINLTINLTEEMLSNPDGVDITIIFEN